jgi:hypothetical protein
MTDQKTRRTDQPTVGFYLIHQTRNGPWCGGEIKFHDGQWSAMIDGKWEGPSANPWILGTLVALHSFGKFSTESEVGFRIGRKRWAEIHDPSHIAANPDRPLNLDVIIPF